MAELLAKYDDLLARLDWTLSPEEERIARSALEDLSDDARNYGSERWASEQVAPRSVRTMVLRAAVRYMRNPDGYIQSRAGDEIVGWAPRKDGLGAAEFSDKEKDELRDLASKRSYFQSVQTYVYHTPGSGVGRRDIHVPVDHAGKGFPLP